MVCFNNEKLLRISFKVLCCCLACLLQRPSKCLCAFHWQEQKLFLLGAQECRYAGEQHPVCMRLLILHLFNVCGLKCSICLGMVCLVQSLGWLMHAALQGDCFPQRVNRSLDSVGCWHRGCFCLSLHEQNVPVACNCSSTSCCLGCAHLCMRGAPLPICSY